MAQLFSFFFYSILFVQCIFFNFFWLESWFLYRPGLNKPINTYKDTTETLTCETHVLKGDWILLCFSLRFSRDDEFMNSLFVSRFHSRHQQHGICPQTQRTCSGWGIRPGGSGWFPSSQNSGAGARTAHYQRAGGRWRNELIIIILEVWNIMKHLIHI